MKMLLKLPLFLATTFCASAAFAQLTVDEKPNAAPERSFSDTPFPDALKKQIGYITAEMLQGPLGDNMRARTDASNSPVSLDDAYTRRNIRDIPGERIDMRTGALSLSATDLAIPGDGAMPLSVSRTRTDSFFENEYDNLSYERRKGDLVGDWGLNVPYIQLISAGAYDYLIGSQRYEFIHTPWSFGGVCERPMPPDATSSLAPGSQVESDYLANFRGVQIVGLADSAPMELLTFPLQRITIPRVYTSTENWEGRCAQSQYSFPTAAGPFFPWSKFIITAPNGSIYEFDEPSSGNNEIVLGVNIYLFGHMRIFLSKVTDINGNWTKYIYNDTLFQPGIPRDFRDYAYLDRMETSDGKIVQFTWECNKYSDGNIALTDPLCRPATSNRQGMPYYRLKKINYAAKQFEFKYNDLQLGTNKGRYLTEVIGPGGQSTKYDISFNGGNPTLYNVTYPSAAKISYGIGLRIFERGANYNVGWRSTAVVSKTVNDLDGPVAKTNFCYVAVRRDGDSPPDSRTYVLEPTRTAKYTFFRERKWGPGIASNRDADAWKEGLPTSETVYDARPASTSCTSVIAETSLVKRRSETWAWASGISRVGILPPTDTPQDYFYPQALVRARRQATVVSNSPDIGEYSTIYSQFDLLMRPHRMLQSIANASGARVSNTTYINSGLVGGRLDLVDTVTVDGITGLVDNDYDARGNLTSTKNYGVTSTFGYFANGNLQWAEDARAKRTNFGNYRFGQPQSVTNPDLSTAVQVVDDYGRTTSLTNERGIATSFTYDLLDRLATVTPTIGPTTKITWSSDFRTKTTQRLGLATKGAAPVLRTDVYQFDALGRLTQETQAGTLVTKLGYDEVGRQKYVTDLGNGAAVARTETTYDALDRARTTSRFDAANALVSSTSVDFSAPETRTVTDGNGNTSTSTYRSFGAPNYEQMLTARTPVTVISPVGVAVLKSLGTDFSPDILGFSPTVVQGEQNSKNQLTGQVRRYALNSKRQMISEYAPEIAGTVFDGLYNVSYCRDEIGNIVAKSLNAACANAATANLVSSQYDDRNRITAINYANSAAPSKTILYSENGNVEKITRSNGVILDPEYNEIDQLKQQDYMIDQFKFRVKFDFDLLQNVKAIIYPSGKIISLAPDVLGRIRKVSPYVSNIDYFDIGAPKEITYSNGQKTTATLTAQNGVDTLKTDKAGVTAINLDYGYDLNNNPTSVADALNPADNLEAQYDQLNRLIKQNYVMLPNGSNMYRSYDAIGNVLFDRSPEGDVTFNYDATSNRLLSASSSNPAIFPNHSYSYDRLGNVQSDGIRTLNFNAASELSSGSRNGQSKTLMYDGAERIIKEVSNGETHYLVHLGENLILDFNATANKYTEFAYLGNQLVGSRSVANAAANDSDNDGKTDLSEFQTPD
jgi:YD repeat-containing protein